MNTCSICNKEYEPPYNTERLKRLSNICPNCVKTINEQNEQKQQEMLDSYNYGSFPKYGYLYISSFVEYMRRYHNQGA